MERLNLRPLSKYDYSDEADSCEQNINFYCVSEGATEESYLRGINNNKRALDIRNNVIIKVVEKVEENETYSYALQLVDACLFNMGCRDKDGNDISKDKWDENCQWDGYNRDIDKVCVLFDRDFRGIESVLDNRLEVCNKFGIEVIMSNPNFELWLLMHFSDIQKYDKLDIKANKKNLRHQIDEKASTKKKFLEIEVAKHASGYTKGSKIKFERFINGIDLAIENAKLFEEDPQKLTTEIGTAMGNLVEQMKI